MWMKFCTTSSSVIIILKQSLQTNNFLTQVFQRISSERAVSLVPQHFPTPSAKYCMPIVPVSKLIELQSNTEGIRNISIVAHVDHGTLVLKLWCGVDVEMVAVQLTVYCFGKDAIRMTAVDNVDVDVDVAVVIVD